MTQTRQWKTIGETCTIVNGGTPKTGVPEYWDGDHKWLTPAEMGKRLSPYISQTQRTISGAGLRNSSARLLPPNSVILSSRAPIGHLAINTEAMATNQGCKGLIPNAELNPKYLYYYLQSIVELLDSMGTGTTFKELSGGKLKAVKMPVPALGDQLRIVRLLDEAFEGIAIAKFNAEKNIQNARAHFQSQLETYFKLSRNSWNSSSLGQVAELRGRIGWRGLTAKEYTKAGPLFLSVHSLNHGDFVDFREAFHISEERYLESPEIMLQNNDVLICKDGAGIGKLAIVGNIPGECTINSSLLLIRSSNQILPKYLYWCLTSPYFQRIVQARLNGTTTPHLYQRDIAEFPIVLPPLDVQQDIVSRLDVIRVEVNALENTYKRKINMLDSLKQSLLNTVLFGNIRVA